MPLPNPTDFIPYQEKYISQTQGDDVKICMDKSRADYANFWKNIPKEKWDYAYAPGKWKLREVLQHIVDTERILSYRALCIARGETQSLPAFEENDYAKNSHAALRNWDDLLNEANLLRELSNILFQSFTDADIAKKGLANNNPITVNALGFIIVGHAMHHQQIVVERYL